MEEESEEARKVKKVMDPKEPTAAERKEHEATHLPFRNWCRHCVRGRGLQAGHYKVKEEERKVPEISIDYCFPASEGQEGITVLVARERGTRMTCATQVPRKGTKREADGVLEGDRVRVQLSDPQVGWGASVEGSSRRGCVGKGSNAHDQGRVAKRVKRV